ncbi:hypothetical protein M413DRAFT_447888 [Hebeloma cylindrosporum]|uniref:Mitochondrial carrier n=1 Tax=Hebeloma cylindrosporum TaxID=76867 RepID=A0A0C2YBQ4_HEBCY|nr:hypothetical protein M413DRAFT_447888 [Hebeloma cylindrosporum h7]
MAACITHPLDVTKVRMQTLANLPSTSTGVRRPSTISVIRTSIQQSGVRSLYVGLSASLLRQMSYSMVRLGAYDAMKTHLSKDKKPTALSLLLAACVAGGMGGIVGNPADILLIRMTSDIVRPPEKRFRYSNVFSGLANLVKNEGVSALTRGLGTNTFRAVLLNASQVGSYDFIKTSLLSKPVPLTVYQFQDNMSLHLVSSSLAGMFATTVCAPADVLKSRIMAASGEGTSVAQILARSLREEGPRFLFKGWTPAFIRMGPNTILMFVFYEQLKHAWKAL